MVVNIVLSLKANAAAESQVRAEAPVVLREYTHVELADSMVGPAIPEPFVSDRVSRNWNRVSSTALVPRIAVSVSWTLLFLVLTFCACEARLKLPTPPMLDESM